MEEKIDKIIEEPEFENPEFTNIVSEKIRNEIMSFLQEMKGKSKDVIVEERYQKFRNMGKFKVL